MSESDSLFTRAQQVIPGGVNSPVRAFKAVGGHPRFIQRGEGPFLIDEDHQRYIDYVNSWGALILGHAHPNVVAAVQHAVSLGLGFGTATRREIELAEKIRELMPSMEKIRLVNSGTEATMTAIRLARGFTGRSKIIKFNGCYHGHSDGLLVKSGSGLLTFGNSPSSAGVPASVVQETLIAEFNDLDSVVHLFESHPNDIAGIIVEPFPGNMNLVFPKPGFLEALQRLCQAHQSVFILDEVMTGFRVALGGAQALLGLAPDLTTLSKIIGGGLPVGAVGGRSDIMDRLSPLGDVYQAGTLSGNPITVSAGLATLNELKPEQYQTLSSLTQQLTQGLMDIAQATRVSFYAQAIGGMFGIYFTDQESITSLSDVMTSDIARFNAFFQGMLRHGCYFAPSAFEAGFVTLAHTESEIQKTLEAAEAVFQELD